MKGMSEAVGDDLRPLGQAGGESRTRSSIPEWRQSVPGPARGLLGLGGLGGHVVQTAPRCVDLRVGGTMAPRPRLGG